MFRILVLALSLQESACFSLGALGPASARSHVATKPSAASVQMFGPFGKKEVVVEKEGLAALVAPVTDLLEETTAQIDSLLEETTGQIQTIYEESPVAVIWEEGTGNDIIDYGLSIPKYFARNGGVYW